MELPSKNWVTCDANCHGYLATDYSWHISKFNYTPRLDWVAPISSTITRVEVTTGDCGWLVEGVGKHNGNDIRWRGCHSNRFYVLVGEKVLRGARVARIGNTGKSTGAHLHFVMWVNGKRVDPDKYIKENLSMEKYKDIDGGYNLWKEDQIAVYGETVFKYKDYQEKYKNWYRWKFNNQMAETNQSRLEKSQEKLVACNEALNNCEETKNQAIDGFIAKVVDGFKDWLNSFKDTK